MTRVNKGIRFEYKIKKELEKDGWYVIRSAGSHGRFDLVAIHEEKKEIQLLQLKRGQKKYISQFEDLAKIEGLFNVSTHLIVKED